MSKMYVIRASGYPVEANKLEEFKTEWRERYDTLSLEAAGNMPQLQANLEKLENELSSKYDTILEVNLPKSHKAWNLLLERYGSALLTSHKENGKLVLVIQDLQYE